MFLLILFCLHIYSWFISFYLIPWVFPHFLSDQCFSDDATSEFNIKGIGHFSCSWRCWNGCGWFPFLFAPKPKAQGIALIKGTSLTYPDGLELSDQTQWHRFDVRVASKHRPVAPLMNCYNTAMFCKQLFWTELHSKQWFSQKWKFSSFTHPHIIPKPYDFLVTL